MLDIYAVFIFILGAVLGSFANVLILRLPAQESILAPSHCRGCNQPVGWANNIPILSYFILGGRCGRCGAKFSIRYPLVEFIMAVLFTAAYLKLGMTWFLVEFLIFIFGAVTASFIDIDHFILPDVFTLGGLAIALVGAALNPERHFFDAVIGAFIGGGILYITAYVHFKIRGIEGMGGGDIKLLGWIGALMGWPSIPFVLLVSSLTSLMYVAGRRAVRKTGWQEPIQWGPFIVLAALAFVFLDPPTIVQALSF